MRFTTIRFEHRKELGLSYIEYAVCESIFTMSVNEQENCMMNRQNMADLFGVSKRQLQKILASLEEKNLIQKTGEYQCLSVTDLFLKNRGVENDTGGMSEMPRGDVENDREGVSKMTGNYNIVYNKSIKSNTKVLPKEPSKKIDTTPFEEIVELYHQTCIGLPRVLKLNRSRKDLIRARIKEHGLESMAKVFLLVRESDFLSGRTKEWQATFDWIIKSANFIKILEGNYKNKKPRKVLGYDEETLISIKDIF